MKAFRKLLSVTLALAMAFSMGTNSTQINLYAQEPEVVAVANEEPAAPVQAPQAEQEAGTVAEAPEDTNDSTTDPEQAATEQETEPIDSEEPEEEAEEIEQEDEGDPAPTTSRMVDVVRSAEVVKLQPGQYKLVETKAPNGYKIAAPIYFTVDVQGVINITDKKYENVLTADAKHVVMIDVKAGTDTGVDTNSNVYTTGMMVSMLGALAILLKRRKEAE